MRVLTFGLGLALALTLTSCGGGPPRTTKKKAESAPAAPALPAPPVPVKKPAPAKTTAAAPAKTEGSAAGDAPAAAVDAGPKDVLATDVPMPGGKSIDSWSRQLDSKDNAQVIEALDAVRLFHNHMGPLKPKVEALTKSANADIAKAAKEALAELK